MGMERSVGKKRVESTGASAIQSAELVLRWFRSDTKRLRAGFNKFNQLPAIWEWNDQWARSELKALGLLQSNRLSWSYDGSLRKTVFTDKEINAEFSQIVGEINTAFKERTLLQQQLQKIMEQNSSR